MVQKTKIDDKGKNNNESKDNNSKQIIVKNPNGLPEVSYKKLKDFQGDLKKINKESLRKLADSILEHGFFIPKFVWKNKKNELMTIDGHQTKKALILLESEGYKIPKIPILYIEAENSTDAAKKILQLNSRYGKFNSKTNFFEVYSVPVEYIKNIEIEELECKVEVNTEKDDEDNYVPEANEKCILKLGDLVKIGDHKILCGDANNIKDCNKLFSENSVGFLTNHVRMAILDPPYDMKDYAWVKNIENFINDGYCFIMCDDQQVQDILKQTDMKLQRFFILDHTFSSPKGNDVYVRHVLMMRLAKGKPIPFKNLKDGFQTIIKMNYRGFLEREEKMLHPHQKPVSIYNKFIEHFSDENFKILDIFLGSGTVLISGERMNRQTLSMELDPMVMQIAVNRLCNERNNWDVCINGELVDFNDYKRKKDALDYKK